MAHAVGIEPFVPAKPAIVSRRPVPNLPVPRLDNLALDPDQTDKTSALVEGDPEMRLKSFQMKPHTTVLTSPEEEDDVASWPPASRPELASLASFAQGLIPDHDGPKQHLCKTY